MIVGVSGKARSGKDTFAEMLAESLQTETGKAYVMMAYAHELKLRVQKDFDMSYEQLWGDEKEIPDKRYPKPDGDGFWTPREILQAYGQFFRTIDYDFWVKHLFRVIEDKEYKNVLDGIAPLNDLLGKYQPNLSQQDTYFVKEFVLWALSEYKQLSKLRFSEGVQFKDPYGSFISGI